MSSSHVTRLVLLSIGGAVVVAMTAGCGGPPGAGGSGTPSSSSATVSASPTPSESGGDGTVGGTVGPSGPPGGTVVPPTATTAPGNAPAECKAADLKLGFGREGAAAGSIYRPLQFTNIGGKACRMVGFPGVSFVAPDNGQQVGAPAERSGSVGAPVTLAPGQVASAVVQEANTGNYPVGDCQPVPVAGFRVYPPDDRAAMFIPFSSPGATACSSNQLSGGAQLLVQAIKPGSGGQ
jgi:hypothetical protein